MKTLCKPCHTTTECRECWGEPKRPVVSGFEVHIPEGFYRIGNGMCQCGRCKGTGKAPLTYDHFSTLYPHAKRS
jgi:hypothetical protein